VTFSHGQIEGVVIKDLRRHADQRGWLSELFRSDEIDPAAFPAMGYVSETKPGMARGPHEHRSQGDCFCFFGPSTFRIYLWDNRSGSPSFGRRMVLEAGEKRAVAIIIPAGVVHAYKNIGGVPGWSLNFPNSLYGGVGRKSEIDEIRYEDDPETLFRLD